MPKLTLFRVAIFCGPMMLTVPPTNACPVCDQKTGKAVRAGIFDENFGFNLAAVILPFGIFLGITAAIHVGLPWKQKQALVPSADTVSEST